MSVAIAGIINRKGLHARAAAKFVKTVTSFQAQVSVIKLGQDGEEDSAPVGGSSILGLMMLGADAGSVLSMDATGPQASELLRALEELLANRFGEPE